MTKLSVAFKVALFDFFPRTLKIAQPIADKNIKKAWKYDIVKSSFGYKRYTSAPKAIVIPINFFKVNFSFKKRAIIIIVSWTTANKIKVPIPAAIFIYEYEKQIAYKKNINPLI